MEGHQKQLKELELALLDPSGRADTSLLDRLISSEFVEVGANGRTFGKEDVLARLPLERGVSFRTEHVSVYLIAPTVGLVTYTAERTADGSTVRSKRCSIWRLDQDEWQVIYHQGTVA